MTNQEIYNRMVTFCQERKAAINHAKRTIKNYEADLDDKKDQLELVEESISLCNKALEQRVNLRKDIEELVTLALQEMFGEDYAFELQDVLNKDNELVGLKPMIVVGQTAHNPDDFGGGVRNIVGTMIRLSFLLIRDDIAPVQVLDEPNINLSKENWDVWYDFLKKLQEDVDFQMIVISHSGVEFDNIIKVKKVGGSSKVSV